MNNKKNVKIIALILIIISSFFLYSPSIRHNQILIDYGEYEKGLIINSQEDVFDYPGPLNTLRKITSPFDLKYYDLYLKFDLKENSNCYMIYPEEISYEIEGQIKYLNRSIEEPIKTIKADEVYNITLLNFTYKNTPSQDYLNAHGIEIPKNKTANLRTNITVGEEVNYYLTAKMNPWDALGNMFIFSVFWIGFILLLEQIILWIKKS